MAQTLTTYYINPTITKPKKTPPSCLGFQASLPSQKAEVDTSISISPVHRRNIISFGVAGAILGLNFGEKNAWAAARRPPPPSQGQERKDPNISGVQAKVIASKKRKEALKQAMAKQRERGKQIEQ